MTLNWTIADFVSAELNIGLDLSRTLVGLFDSGHEIPFIARYRRHITQDSSPDDLRHAFKAYNDANEIKAKADKYVKRVENEVQAPEYQKTNLKLALSKTMDKAELESLMAPFKKAKKNSLAAQAALLVGLETRVKVEKAVLDYLSCDLHRMQETLAVAREITQNPKKFRLNFVVRSTYSTKGWRLRQEKPDNELLERFRFYIPPQSEKMKKTDFKQWLAEDIKDFQILALQRAEKQGIISWDVRIDPDQIGQLHPGLLTPVHRDHIPFLRKVVADSIDKFFKPSITRPIKRQLLEMAERSAIDCFASNLRELLLTAPLKGKPILAIDPGFKNGCKCVLMDNFGEVAGSAILDLHKTKIDDWKLDRSSALKLVSLVDKASAESVVIAIGNGTASNAIQLEVSSLLKQQAFEPTNVEFCVVSEAGSSVYSASKSADAEFGNMDILLRSAVSIGRRVMDPLSELVKIEPKSLGIGLYQHSVNEKRLDEMLDLVVRECVSNVGVDVNVASLQVLQKVAGLNARTAANIVAYRQEKGKILNREMLKDIKGIGPKSFEQCAGFLNVYPESEGSSEICTKKRRLTQRPNPLDATPVHPESYHLAEKIAAMAGAHLSDVGTEAFRWKLAPVENRLKGADPELYLVWELLVKPCLVCNPPRLMKEVSRRTSVSVGEVIEGVVMNNAKFGAFVDIGIGFNGLLHCSRFGATQPRVNSRIRVRVDNIEMDRKRIGLTMA